MVVDKSLCDSFCFNLFECLIYVLCSNNCWVAMRELGDSFFSNFPEYLALSPSTLPS